MDENKFKINPIIPLAYNMADCCQKYVLFIGAGVSKDAGVPSGWDTLLDILRKIRQQEENITKNFTPEEMEEFYKEKYEKKFGYSEIISSLFPSHEEQREYLKGLFEGILPGDAHKLIAEMVNKELVKFIITTNFDSLLEQALDDIGLRGRYTVISSDEDVQTSKPWTNEEVCRIYKINGTIEKGLIKNTKKDLEYFSENLRKDFLDIVERHGVIVLGYAANKDDKAIFEVLNSRRFKGYTLYWTCFEEQLSYNAKILINKQDGIVIPIKGAGLFLKELMDRVDLAQRGTEQTAEAVAEVRFEALLKAPKAEFEVVQTIETERKNIIRYLSEIIEKIDEKSYESLWDGFLKIFKYTYNYLLLTEQIVKYRSEYWEHIIQIFDQMHSLNKNRDRYGKSGIVNYLFYSLLEILGATLIENEKFRLLRKMLEIKRLNARKDGMEDILDWNIQAQFIEIKNEEEGKKKGQKWIMPRFHYLLDAIATQDFPLEFDIKARLIETDLLFFVYSIKNPIDSISHFWFPCSPVYSTYGAPDLFKKIRHDKKFGGIIATELFEIDYEGLIQILSKAKEIIHSRFSSAYFSAVGAEEVFDDF